MLLTDEICAIGRLAALSREADAIEAVIFRERVSTIRFANSVFHQGGTEDDCTVYVRAIAGRRIGIASSNRLEKGPVTECVRKAASMARHLKDEPFELKFPGPSAYVGFASFYEATARAGYPQGYPQNVSIISSGFKKAAGRGVLQSGSLSTTVGEIAVFNSSGCEAYHPFTVAHFSAVSTSDGASGLATGISKDIDTLDMDGLLALSSLRCLEAATPRGHRPGRYRVYLEPQAVAELLHWLSYTGFGARSFHEGMSFLSGKVGETVTGKNVTIYDDGLSGLSVPFDMEGTPRRRTALIEKGVARGVVYDTLTGGAYGSATTGNAPFAEEAEGPLPDHIFMEAGDMPSKDALERLGEGILVRSFHYVNGLLNPLESMMTGMTRHGTFLVEGGRIKCALRPMRFTENILEAFSRIEAVSSEAALFQNHSFPLSSISAPGVLIDGFSFTS